MKKIINRIFSDKYVNHGAVVGNDVLLLMYRFAYPFSVLLHKLRLSPNQITTQSLIFSILAFIALIYDAGWIWFSIFWGMSVLLDFCDGTVARMTNRVSKTAFRYDHMSDIFKIALVILGVGIRNEGMHFWILCATFIFLYPYSEILSHDLKNVNARKQDIGLSNSTDTTPAAQKRIRERFVFVGMVIEKFPFGVGLLKKLYAAIFGFNGHTLLFFFLLPVGGNVTKVTLLYLIFLTLINCFTSIKSLRRINR